MFSHICKSLESLMGSSRSSLIKAIEDNDVEAVIQAIKNNSDIEEHYHHNLPDLMNGDTQVESGTAIHLAIDQNNLPILKILLKNKANIEAKDSYGRTPLLRAIEATSYSVVSRLLEAKANINARDTRGQTILHKIMLDTPLSDKDGIKKIQLIEYIMKKRLNINQRDSQGKTALMCFLESITPSSRQSYDAMHLESIINSLCILPAIISLFLKHGADIINLKDENGKNVLIKAQECQRAYRYFNEKNKSFYPEYRKYYEDYPAYMIKTMNKHLDRLDIIRLRTFALGVRYDKGESPTKILAQGDVPETLNLIFDFMRHKKITPLPDSKSQPVEKHRNLTVRQR